MNRRTFLGTAAAALTAAPSLISSAQPLPVAQSNPSQPTSPSGGDGALVPRFGDARDWWFKRRFGLFVHWGLYSIAGWHEQLEWRGGVPRKEYEKLFQQFNPQHYNPDAWLDLAESAGMEYICLTTKHHEGFCQWDTKLTDFNCTKTPYGKDVLRQLADACHRRNFPLSLLLRRRLAQPALSQPGPLA